MNTEIWKSIPEFSRYEASSLGKIRHVKYQKIRVLTLNPNGYYQCAIRNDDNIQKNMSVHRLVYSAFYGTIATEKVIDHINRVRVDNRIDNLRSVSQRVNLDNREWLKYKWRRIKPEDIGSIIDLHRQGYSDEDILLKLIE